MSDGDRLQKIGKIADNVDTVASINLLFANDRLFFLEQQLEGQEIKGVKLTYLKEQSATATTILNAWSTNDRTILELCSRQKVLKFPCNIDGLVGFLSDNYSNNNKTWHDEYHYVNAIVTNGEKAPDGITFKGKEGKAVWSVGGQGKEEQPYNFADVGFTLVATVTIDKHDNANDNSLLGLVLEGETKRLGLWCSKDKWVVKVGQDNVSLQVNQNKCSEGNTYIINFVLKKSKTFAIYVDGEQLAVLGKDKITITASENSKYFYFGVDKTTSSATTDVTITNVLLYNQFFTQEEVMSLKPKKIINTDTQRNPGTQKGTSPKPEKGRTEEVTKGSNITEDKQTSLSPTTEDNAVRVGVVGVLCFMLFGVFTLLGCYVY